MKCLGVESSAHTFAIGIIDEKKKILADQRSMYTNEKGGIIPSDAAKIHRTFDTLAADGDLSISWQIQFLDPIAGMMFSDRT